MKFFDTIRRCYVTIRTSLRYERFESSTLTIILSNISTFRREIRESLKSNVAELKKKLPGFQPGLAIVQVGGREDSNVYIRMKLKAATEIGIHAEHIQLPKSITEGELLAKVRDFCKHLSRENLHDF